MRVLLSLGLLALAYGQSIRGGRVLQANVSATTNTTVAPNATAIPAVVSNTTAVSPANATANATSHAAHPAGNGSAVTAPVNGTSVVTPADNSTANGTVAVHPANGTHPSTVPAPTIDDEQPKPAADAPKPAADAPKPAADTPQPAAEPPKPAAPAVAHTPGVSGTKLMNMINCFAWYLKDAAHRPDNSNTIPDTEAIIYCRTDSGHDDKFCKFDGTNFLHETTDTPTYYYNCQMETCNAWAAPKDDLKHCVDALYQ